MSDEEPTTAGCIVRLVLVFVVIVLEVWAIDSVRRIYARVGQLEQQVQRLEQRR